MKYTKKLVAGYELLNMLKRSERRASDKVGMADINTLNEAIGHLEDSLFHAETVIGISGDLKGHAEVSSRYMKELTEIQKECSTDIDNNMIRDAIAQAKESEFYVSTLQEAFDKDE